MSESRKIPAYFRLTGEGPGVELSHGGDGGPRRFEMRAYTGAPVDVAAWGRVIFDLDGMRLGRKKKPILLQHDPSRIVGYSTEVERDEQGIRMAGLLSEKTAAAREVVDLAGEGFPWQASVGLQVSAARYVANDEDPVTVNGLSFKGGFLIQKSYLRESSFVPVGADDDSSGAVLEAIHSDGLVEAETHKEASMQDPSKDPVATFAAEHPEAVDGWRTEGREEARASAKALLSAFPGREKFALEQFLAGADVRGAKAAAYEVVAAENRQLHEKVAAALGADAAADLEPGIGFAAAETEAPRRPRTDDERWEQNADLRAEFGTKEAWQSYRAAEARGAVKILSKGGD
jgi:phage head maturation protease